MERSARLLKMMGSAWCTGFCLLMTATTHLVVSAQDYTIRVNHVLDNGRDLDVGSRIVFSPTCTVSPSQTICENEAGAKAELADDGRTVALFNTAKADYDMIHYCEIESDRYNGKQGLKSFRASDVKVDLYDSKDTNIRSLPTGFGIPNAREFDPYLPTFEFVRGGSSRLLSDPPKTAARPPTLNAEKPDFTIRLVYARDKDDRSLKIVSRLIFSPECVVDPQAGQTECANKVIYFL